MIVGATNNNLVPSRLTIAEQGKFKAHFNKKLHNAIWLGKVVEAIKNHKKNADDCFQWFPYAIKPKSVVTKIIKDGFQTILLRDPIARPRASCCVYLIAMPCIPDREMDPRGGNIQRVINEIEDNAFHTTAAKSLKEIKGRVCVVIGLNTFYSINSDRNEAFRSYTTQLRASLSVRELAVKIIPFFWSPWKSISTSFDEPVRKTNVKYIGYRRKSLPIVFSKKLLFAVDKCYTLVKSYLAYKLTLNPDTKKTVKALDASLEIVQNFGEDSEHPRNSIIPYQEIRTSILHSCELRNLSKFFTKNSPLHPQYIVSLDSDFISLKTDETGLLSHYDSIVFDHYKSRETLPSVMSTGYDAPPTEPMGIIIAGLKLDRKIRLAVAKTMPLAVYMPEPNFAFLLESHSLLKDFSFMKGKRSVMTAESRQLIKVAIKDGLIEPEEMTFIEKGAIQTTIDRDWRTKTVSKYGKVSRTNIHNIDVIKALRGLHQSYADPQIWSNNIYSAIGRVVSNYISEVIAPMKIIRLAFDPYQLAVEMKPQYGIYTSVLFDKALSFMNFLLSNMELTFTDLSNINTYANAFASSITNSRQKREFLNALFKIKVEAILKAEEKLEDVGYLEEEIKNIRTMAIDTGAAVVEFFLDYRKEL